MKDTYYSLTMPQYSIHTQETAYPDTDVNVLYFVIHIKEAVDETLLSEAILRFAQNHKALHTRIRMEDSFVKQYFAVDEAVAVGTEDMTMLTDAQREAKYRTWGQKPFQYQDSPLWEFRILKLSDTMGGLFCKFHHIWCDGWSTGLVWSEILKNYCCLKEGGTPKQKEDALVSFIEERGDYAKSDRYQEDQAFFQEYLKGIEPYHSNRSYAAERSNVFPVPNELSRNIQEFCNKWKITPYAVFMGALAVYDSGTAAKEDVVLGMARLNRDTVRERETLGQFVVELPLHLKVTGELTFPKLCGQVLSESRAVAVHKQYPMADIIKELHRQSQFYGDLSRFALSFQREKIDLGEYRLPVRVWFGCPLVCVEPVVIHVVDLLEDGYQVFYDYRKSCYQEKTIAYLHESLMEIMQKGITDEGTITTIPLVGEMQGKALGASYDEAVHMPERTRTMQSLFLDWVKKEPDKTAVCGVDGSYTYTETYQRAGAVAAHLSKLGISSEESVGVLLPRTCEMVFAVLGILRAGGSFVLMDCGYPSARIRAIMEDCHMRRIITDCKGAEKLSEVLEGAGEASDSAAILIDGIPDAAFTDITIPDTQRCYLIYTSGTTGKPKGVQIEHRTIYNLLLPGHTGILSDVAANGKMAVAMSTVTFDIFLFELFTNLMNGIGVVIASEAETEEPLKLAALMTTYGVNVIYGTPSRLLSYCEFAEFRQAMKEVKVLLSAGEAFPVKLYTTVHQIAPEIHIYNGYGPTEATIGTSFQRVEGTDITLGQPVANYQLRCVDAYGRLVPYETVGELWIGGSGLARGYTDPELTSKAFVSVDGERFYRSGDLVHRRVDNALVFDGRKDYQVKLRGFRIELEEIEGALRAHEAVKEAAVLVKKQGEAEFLCAFYTADQNQNQTLEMEVEAIKQALGESLPHYMIPSVYKRLLSMPLTTNGKSDKQKLAAMEVQCRQTYAAPKTTLQKLLVRLVEQVLQLERVGIDDNFFDIGGDSLSIAHYAVDAMAEGIKFEYSDIFRYPTIRRFAAFLKQDNQSEVMDHEIQDYHYAPIEQLLREQKEDKLCKCPIRRILLTGSTGYLGGHVLYELLKHTDSVIYCLLRHKGKRTPEQNLNARFYYYFEESLLDYLGERVWVYEGNMAEDDLEAIFAGLTFDTVINCAADVAHYSHGAGMRKVNVDSLFGLTKLCKAKQAQLIHISTISIGQFSSDGNSEPKASFDEDDFYFSQDLSNEYIKSKFLAERIVLDKMAEDNLEGFIARVGNLQGRYSDGEFQINYKKNAFLTRLRSYIRLGFMPQSGMDGAVDYSPIDYVARAICLLAGYRTNRHVYHILNDKETTNADFFHVLEEQGHPLLKLTDEAYGEAIRELLTDDKKRLVLSDMAADLNKEMKGKHPVPITCEKTAGILKELGFAWPEIDRDYLKIYIQGISQLGFFDDAM